MLTQHFFIENYDWEVYAFYYVESIHRIDIYKYLERLNYLNIIEDIDKIVRLQNGGYCYTNFTDRRSLMLVNVAENNEQMCNTIVHELNHLSSHIEEYYRIDSHSEEACYLIGSLAQRVFHFLNYGFF